MVKNNMLHQAYLLFLSQLRGKHSSHIHLHDRCVQVEYLEKKKLWLFSAPVYEGEKAFPQEVEACLSKTGSASRALQGVFLKLAPNSSAIVLQKEFSWEIGKYIPFKQSIEEFISLADEWQEVFCQLATFYK